MHGDEPTATCALVDLLSHLVATRAEPATRQLLSRLTLLVLPMLNPDGAARNDRRNAQGIDINRDAVELQTPEGRFLKAVRDRYAPAAGFNLHNQGALVTAGPTGPQSALAVLAVPGAESEPDGPAVARKKGLGAVMARAAEPFGPGRVARYDMSYTERAFGDSMSRWGTPTVLLETGGWDGPDEAERLVRLNFVVLLSALHALARGEEALAAPAYETLPFNARGRLVDLILRDATVHGGRELPPFHADVAFVRPRSFAGEGQRLAAAMVTGVGDLNHLQRPRRRSTPRVSSSLPRPPAALLPGRRPSRPSPVAASRRKGSFSSTTRRSPARRRPGPTAGPSHRGPRSTSSSSGGRRRASSSKASCGTGCG